MGDLHRGGRLTLIGIDGEGICDALRADAAATRSALLLASVGTGTAEAILNRLLNDLADLALSRWPHWYDECLELDFAEYAKSDPLVSAPWLRAAVKLVEAGRPPHFRRLAKPIAFMQLMRVIDPHAPVLIATVDSASPARAAPVIQVLEWCAAQGASVVAAFPERPPFEAPYDRILYGALDFVHDIKPVTARFVAPPRSGAHPGSVIEQRVEAALRRDAELAPLFEYNQIVATDCRPRVDLLWREGRIVVELDGPEHQNDPKFADDRHRDYELLVAGYLVLRITNRQVETDLQRTIEKIRAVVRFRRSSEGIGP